MNELIERHNRNFPAEARLPMDPRTRDFVKINGRPYQRDALDEAWILERFPADLRAARRAAATDPRGHAPVSDTAREMPASERRGLRSGHALVSDTPLRSCVARPLGRG